MTDATRYHIDPNDMGLRRCARPHDCAWGSASDHYSTPAAGFAAIENMMSPLAWPRFHKRSPGHRHVQEYVKPVR